MNGAGARRQKALVPLIEAGHERSHRQRDSSPYDGPARIVPHRNASPPGTKKQDAQDGITNNVACFSDQEMPSQESDRLQTEKEVENRIQEPAEVTRSSMPPGTTLARRLPSPSARLGMAEEASSVLWK